VERGKRLSALPLNNESRANYEPVNRILAVAEAAPAELSALPIDEGKPWLRSAGFRR
jgi:hypothetical protein